MKKKYIKDGKIINATEKAFDVLYKDKGFKLLENKALEEDIEEEKEVIDTIGIDEIKKDEIIEILNEKGIDHNPNDKKEILFDLMTEGD